MNWGLTPRLKQDTHSQRRFHGSWMGSVPDSFTPHWGQTPSTPRSPYIAGWHPATTAGSVPNSFALAWEKEQKSIFKRTHYQKDGQSFPYACSMRW